MGLLGVAGGSQDLRTGWLVNRTSMVTLPDDSGLARTGHICPANPVGLRGAKGLEAQAFRMKTTDAILMAVGQCSLVRMGISASGSCCACGLPFFPAVWDDWREK